MKTDYELQQDVQDELMWDPILNAPEIGVIVKDGVVTLTGIVDSFSKKIAAESAAKRVKEVIAVAVNIDIILPGKHLRTDAEIAKAAFNALKWSNIIPDEKLMLQVENGYISVEGEVEWQYQKDSVTSAIKDLQGIKGITNLIHVKPRPGSKIINNNIRKALQRIANLEADKINVMTTGSDIKLTGNVHSWLERAEVERAVWSTPGVTAVHDELTIS